MKKLLLLGFILYAQLVSGQLIIKPIKTDLNIARTDQSTKDLTPISLPFWDDFSYAGDSPDSLWEFSHSIYVNEAIAIDPPTYKAATFDGLDDTGQLHDASDDFGGLGDQLISRRIDLSSYTAGNETLFLSFFWEAGGNGERPEGTDSLRLQFLNSDSVWVTEWKIRADAAASFDSFTQEILNVGEDYFHKDFRFKFEAYGSLLGPFDTWHVDYVYLDEGRTSTDLTYFDRAFTGSLSSLIEPYREMPSEHFFADPDKYLKFQSFKANNLDDSPHTLAFDYELENKISGDLYTFSDGGNAFLSQELKEVEFVEKPAISVNLAPEDSVVLVAKVSSNFGDNIPPFDSNTNDTLGASYTFQNYYAYDDGVAEFAGGIPQNKGSIAVMYVVETKDTLTHVDIHFPTIEPLSEGSSINVNVWFDLEGSDPVASKSYTIVSSDRNEFQRIQFTQPVIVYDTMYVGFTQKTNNFISVGVDRSNLAAADKAYFKTTGNIWQQNSQVQGVLMIRPVFANVGDLVLNSKAIDPLSIYPNPNSGELNIAGQHEGIRILALDGKVMVAEHNKPTYNISSLKSGIYIINIKISNEDVRTFKLIKE